MPYLIASLNYIWTKLWPVLNPNQALSWRTFLFLCLFSWIVALPTSDGPWILAHIVGDGSVEDASALFFQMSLARWLLFTLGWICLCLSMAWLLVRSIIVVPFFAIKIYPAAWVVGLLTSTYFFLMGTGDVRTAAIVGWPLISAGYTLLPKVFTAKGVFITPPPNVRQQFTILFLASATISCWLQFHVLAQKWITDYPVLLLGPIEESAFVMPMGDRPPVFDIAQATLNQTLELQSISQVASWLQNVDLYSEAVNDRFQSKLDAAQKQLLNNWWEEVQDDRPSPTTNNDQPSVPNDVTLEPEQWSMSIAPDQPDPLGVGILMELRSRPLKDSRMPSRAVSMIYPCIVEPYTPRQNRVSRPLADSANSQESLPANPLPPSEQIATEQNTPERASSERVASERVASEQPTSENVEDYIKSRVQCYDLPNIKVTRAVR